MVGLGERLLGHVVSGIRVLEEAQQERVDAALVGLVEQIERVVVRLPGERDELRVGERLHAVDRADARVCGAGPVEA